MLRKYIITLVILAFATLIQWLVYPYSGDAPFILYYPSVILAALYGDGVLAIIVSCVLGQFLFVNHGMKWGLSWPDDVIRLLLFIVSAVMIRQLTRRLSLALEESAIEKQKVEEARMWLGTTLMSIGDAVLTTDRDGRIIFMNRVAEALCGWKLEEARTRPLEDIFRIVHRSTGNRVENPVAKVLRDGKVVELSGDLILITRDGRELAIADSAAPIRRMGSDIIEGVVLAFRDVSDKYSQQRRLDKTVSQLQESETRLRSVIENALDAVIAMDTSGKVVEWNAHAETIFSFPAQEAVGKKLSDLIIPVQYREAHERGLKHYLQSGVGAVLNRRIEINGMRRGGEEFPVELSITPIHSTENVVFYAFLRDISERRQNEQKLLDAIRARDDFLSIASHELKTPLTTLRLQADLRARRVKRGGEIFSSKDEMTKNIENDTRQIDRLTRLVDDMLDISRIRTGRFAIHAESVELTALVKETLERFRAQFEGAGCAVTLKAPESLPGHWDLLRVEQVVANLLSNALKYGEGKPVRVELSREANWARLDVEDHGRGIAEDDLERIFERFERAVGSKEISGLGLGLYIVRQIVEMHQGTIEVRSRMGEGSCFTLRLPLPK